MGEPILCLCAEEITETAIYPCKHIICNTCCLRLRALMDDKTCPYCRDVPAEEVSVVRNPQVKAVKAQIPLKKYGIMCETEDIKKGLEKRLSTPCPVCNQPQNNQKHFKQHFHDKHPGKAYCRVCAKHEYVFTDELEVYTHKGLNAHIKSEHATCPFCDWHFYSNKELNKHCKTQHEICFICEQFDASRPRYFENYLRLKDHFEDEHYMCKVPSCLEDKFIVFGSKIELQNHMLEEHKSLVNVKEMKNVDIEELQNMRLKTRPPQEDEKVTVKRRYKERLRIDAKNDNGLIDQIMQANHTFETKKVPADVFIKTYETILSGVPEDEIIVLVHEFSKFSTLATDKQKQLDLALSRRRPEPISSSNNESKPSSSSRASPQPGPSRAAPMGAYGQWAGRKNTGVGSGGIDRASLPRLGGGAANRSSSSLPDVITRPPRIPVAKKVVPLKPSLPRLPAQSSQTWGQGPQTRLPPLGGPRTTRPVWMAPDEPDSSSNLPSAGPSSSWSSPSSSANSSSTNLSRPNFGALPSLPGGQQQQSKKSNSKQKRVVRIV